MTPRAASVDEGWGIPDEPTGSLICAVPSPAASEAETSAFEACDFEACVAGASELGGGWNLAEGTVEHEVSEFAKSHGLPLRFRPVPLASDQVLSAEAQEEFSKPDLALGTDVDLPPPAGLWFADLAPVVARRVPRSARQTASAGQELNTSCSTPSEDSLFAEGEEIEGASQVAAAESQRGVEAEAEPRRRWWHWRR